MSTGRVSGFVLFFVFAACFVLASSALPPVRIMPLGDSITYGVPVAGGYRASLYASLTNLGYTVDFVGTQTANALASLPDSDHEGHSGWTIDTIDGSILGFLNAVLSPDVVLLHIGTNDANTPGTFTNAIDRLDALVTHIATNRPYAHIIVTSLLPRGEEAVNAAITNLFNPFVPNRVAAQAALGRRVTYLDMHAYLTTNDLSDTAHPNQAGYNKMADAWLTALTNVIAPTGDWAAPKIASAQGLSSARGVALTFSKPVSLATATNLSNYAASGGLPITGATLDASQRSVVLTTGLQTAKTAYTLTVNNVCDLTAPTPLSIAADSAVAFTAATPRGYSLHIPESTNYTLVYSLDIPAKANYSTSAVPYTVDNHYAIGTFSRVAYYMELQKTDGDLTYVWASMDAFTNNTAALGVPTRSSDIVIQKSVSNLNVDSNDPGITTGAGFTGNLEFWPYNYVYANSGVPGASDLTCDFGDTVTLGSGSYGCLQIHNTTAQQTLIAYNNWNGFGNNSDVGIGNQTSGQPDWTFSYNAATYIVKNLQVLVLRDSDTTAPTLVSAQPDAGRTNITVRFSEPLAPSSVNALCFSLDNGVPIIGATLSANQRDVVLLTTRQPDGAAVLSVTGLRDAAAGNPIAPGSTIVVDCGSVTYPLPAEVAANVPEAAGYQLACSVNIPVNGNFDTSTSDYSNDVRAAIGSFSRIAYYLELKKITDATPSFVWVSMDAFTTNAAFLGFPRAGTNFQQKVTRMNVRSNVSGVNSEFGISTGNIEIFPCDFGMGNGLGIPGASATAFDFGDAIATPSAVTGHGCLQVHNYGATQTVFAVNHFNKNNLVGLGIGNNPAPNASYPDPDWTATYNAASYERRLLHVFVLPGATNTADVTAPTVVSAVPSTSLDSVAVTFSETLADTAAAVTNFAINQGVPISHATFSSTLKTVVLKTGALASGQTYTVTVSGVHDRSISGNQVAQGSTATFATPSTTLPVAISGVVPEASNYALVYKLAAPNYGNFVPYGAYYSLDESLFPKSQKLPFDRIAYCLELVTNGVTEWAYVSMDAFANDISKIGVPTVARGAVFQTYVSNMNVYASDNVAVTTGAAIATGNIEFFPSNFSGANDKNIPGAVGDKTFDFGDTTGSLTAGHGSMQIHNYGAKQTILSFSRFGTGMELALGLGNNTNFTYGSGYEDPDWTLSPNARTYSTKNLYVLVHWGGSSQDSQLSILAQPVSRSVLSGGSVRFYVQVVGATAYQWRHNGVDIADANQAWLEIAPVDIADAGDYTVVVYGSGSTSTTSATANLHVILRGTVIKFR